MRYYCHISAMGYANRRLFNVGEACMYSQIMECISPWLLSGCITRVGACIFIYSSLYINLRRLWFLDYFLSDGEKQNLCGRASQWVIYDMKRLLYIVEDGKWCEQASLVDGFLLKVTAWFALSLLVETTVYLWNWMLLNVLDMCVRQ
jgi:hypothetical protein